jgi:hypothetical protein
MNDLIRWYYVPPSWEVFHKILAANGLEVQSEKLQGYKGFVAHEGRASDKIIIPAGVFGEPMPSTGTQQS